MNIHWFGFQIGRKIGIPIGYLQQLARERMCRKFGHRNIHFYNDAVVCGRCNHKVHRDTPLRGDVTFRLEDRWSD